MSHQENIISAQIDGGLHEEQALLDDFAKAAMQGLVSNPDNLSYIPGNSDRGLVLDGISKDAYDIATAMMQERERRMKG